MVERRVSGRHLALLALQDPKGMVTRRLERLLEEERPNPVEAALATELSHGVVRRMGTLDAVLRAYSKRPNSAMPDSLRHILHLGLYQIIFLDRIPDFAAVDQTVEMAARRFAPQRGFVNGLLRSVSRELGEVIDDPSERIVHSERTIPLTHSRYRMAGRGVFATPGDNSARYLADACSIPEELATRWLLRMGSLERTFDLAMHMNLRPPVMGRVNTTRTTAAEVIEQLKGQGFEAELHENGLNVVLRSHVKVAELEVFKRGLLTVQDATATEVSLALDVRPGMRVLDFCSSPGTKTTHIGELMRGDGEIVAVDVSEEKLARVKEAAQRCGIEVQTCLAGEVTRLKPESFDRVLVDAPCSNTGVLARRVEARWRFQARDVRRLANDQRNILSLASLFVKSGGRLVYSTCSIEPEENEQTVAAVAKGGLRVEKQKLTLPAGRDGKWHTYRDGGFWARLSR